MGVLQEKVYIICIDTNLNELKQRLRIALAKMHHVVIAAAICQWCC